MSSLMELTIHGTFQNGLIKVVTEMFYKVLSVGWCQRVTDWIAPKVTQGESDSFW